MTSREQLNDITKQIEELQAQRQKLCKDALAGHEAIDETGHEIFRFFAQRAPDAEPPARTFRRLIWDETVKMFDRRCAEAVAQMNAAIERARNGR